MPQRLSPLQASSHRIGRVLRTLRILSLAVPAVATALIVWTDYKVTLAAAETQVQRSIGILREHVQKVFEIYDLILDEVAAYDGDQVGMPAQSRAMSSFLKRLQAPREEIASIWVVGPDGTPLAASTPWSDSARGEGRDYFEAQRRRDAGTYIGKTFVGHATRQLSFGISRRRVLHDGSFNGTIHVAVSADYFERFFRTALPEARHVAALVRSDGELLARDPPLRPLPHLDAQGLIQRSLAETDRKMLWSVSPADGVERLLAFERIGTKPVYVIYGLDKAAILQPWLHRSALYVLLGVGSALALFLLATVALRRTRSEQALIARLQEEMARREQMEETLRQAQHLEALGQLTGGVAHDFNNILTAIIGNLELIGSHAPPGDRSGRLAEAALKSAGRAARLVQHLLAFARRQRLQPQHVDMDAMIQDSLSLYRRALGETIELAIELPADLWPCRLDPAQLEAAILNILLNARDAMPGGGTVWLTAQNVRAAADEIPGLAPGAYVTLAIRDSGTGMAPEVLARAFEPFYTTKEVGKGSGLGLSMVHGFAAQSGGTVRLESEPGRGTTVRLYLPRAARQADAPRRTAADAARGVAPSRAVLVVEDDEDVRRVTAEALESCGYRPLLAANAADALDLLGRERVDMMVSDVVMPGGMSGIELAQAARRRRRDMPVLLITGYAAALEAEPEADGVEVLRKPFLPADLFARLAQLSTRHAETAGHGR